jgi:hypothetical protein
VGFAVLNPPYIYYLCRAHGAVQGIEVGAEEELGLGSRHEIEGSLGDEGEGAFGSTEKGGQVEARSIRHPGLTTREGIQGVAGIAPHHGRRWIAF